MDGMRIPMDGMRRSQWMACTCDMVHRPAAPGRAGRAAAGMRTREPGPCRLSSFRSSAIRRGARAGHTVPTVFSSCAHCIHSLFFF